MFRFQPLRLAILGALLLPVALSHAANPPKGFAPLFNGKDFTGWYGWDTRNPEDLWKMTLLDTNYQLNTSNLSHNLFDKIYNINKKYLRTK
jgi:hypothetical protein